MKDLQLQMANSRVTHVRITPTAGCCFSAAKHDALQACMQTRARVIFDFNGEEYIINYEDLHGATRKVNSKKGGTK